MTEQQNDSEADNSVKKPKLLLIVIIVFLLVTASLAAFFLTNAGNEEADEDQQKAEAEQVRQTPIYFTIDSPFIVNFSEQSNGAVRYMQIKMKVMARDQTVIDAVKLHLPAIQHEILMLMYSQNYDTLLTTKGTKALQQACQDEINQVIKREEKNLGNELEAVYFTSFIMQ